MTTDYFVVILDRAAMFPGKDAVDIDWIDIAGVTSLIGFSFTDFGDDDGGFPLNGTLGKTLPIISSEGELFCVIADRACNRIPLRARSECASRESVESCHSKLR